MGALLNQSQRAQEYRRYHVASDRLGDIDPSYPMLRYVCERFELNTEQRYWLAFLYAATYCAPTVFYIYNEFPDLENVDAARLERWWKHDGRAKCMFQTDRRWIRSLNQLGTMVASYRDHLKGSQQSTFANLLTGDPQESYRRCYGYFGNVFQLGRMGLFLFLEAVHVVTDCPIEPDRIDWSKALSSRNGLCYALGKDDWLRDEEDGNLGTGIYTTLDIEFWDLIRSIRAGTPDARADVWNVETSLCAFKKWKRSKRYVGYYIDRQGNEILKMARNVKVGVSWDVLFDFRRETWPQSSLIEYNGGFAKLWGPILRQFNNCGAEPVLSPELEGICSRLRT